MKVNIYMVKFPLKSGLCERERGECGILVLASGISFQYLLHILH